MNDTSNTELLNQLKIKLDTCKGTSEAVLVLGEKTKKIIKLPQKIEFSIELESDLKAIFGNDNVKFQ
jgi:hypothetical protein